MRSKLLILSLLLPFALFSQQVERVWIEGVITASNNEDVEGITIYNTSSEKGTITDAEGNFRLEMAQQDRVLVTALQFQDFTIIIAAQDISAKRLSIHLNSNVNRLEEVLVRSTDLTGNLEEDVKRIKTSVFTPTWDLSYATLEYGYYFEKDEKSKIEGNAAEDALNMHTIPVASVDLVELGALLFPKKKKSVFEIREELRNTPGSLWKRYADEYIALTFDIPEGQVQDFIFYAEENGLTQDLLLPENEIQLIAYLYKKSESYKQLADNE